MLRARRARSLEDFTLGPGDPARLTPLVAQLWQAGESRLDWSFVLDDGEERIGRVALRVTPTTGDPAWLGTLPAHELGLVALRLPMDERALEGGRLLLLEALRSARSEVPALLSVSIQQEHAPDARTRCRLLESCGLTLFQEKQGFFWKDDGRAVAAAEHLRFRDLDEVGRDAWCEAMGPCIQDTLDRNDRYYSEGAGTRNWALQMSALAAKRDRPLWLLAYRADEAVGYIALGRHEAWGATIQHVGVRPHVRGQGLVNDLLATGTARLQQAGIATCLSDADVLNTPMLQAMARADHRPDRRPWHVWTYRGELRSLL